MKNDQLRQVLKGTSHGTREYLFALSTPKMLPDTVILAFDVEMAPLGVEKLSAYFERKCLK